MILTVSCLSSVMVLNYLLSKHPFLTASLLMETYLHQRSVECSHWWSNMPNAMKMLPFMVQVLWLLYFVWLKTLLQRKRFLKVSNFITSWWFSQMAASQTWMLPKKRSLISHIYLCLLFWSVCGMIAAAKNNRSLSGHLILRIWKNLMLIVKN